MSNVPLPELGIHGRCDLQARTQTPPYINVLATMMLAVTITLFIVAIVRGNRREAS